MPVLKTTEVSHIREDLSKVITNISSVDVPFTNSLEKTKASSTKHEWLAETLRAPGVNAAVEGSDAPDTALVGPARLNNTSQVFVGTVMISSTLQAVDTAGGGKDELTRQGLKTIKEIKRDVEFALVGPSASSSGSPRRLGGAEAWIKTNALHGANGSTAGFTNGNVGAITGGTQRALTEAMFLNMLSGVWQQGGDAPKVMANGLLKQRLSTFNGGSTRFAKAEGGTVTQAIDVYKHDFGTSDIIPNRFMSTTTVIAYDPSLWAIAVLNDWKKEELGKTGLSQKIMISTELTLECRSEAGNGKIADLNG